MRRGGFSSRLAMYTPSLGRNARPVCGCRLAFWAPVSPLCAAAAACLDAARCTRGFQSGRRSCQHGPTRDPYRSQYAGGGVFGTPPNLRPWCVDLFGDADLCSRCPTQTIAPDAYPAGLVRQFHQAPPGPWMYTGALENRPALIRQLARLRRLWGNDALVLAVVRSPQAVHNLLRAAGLPCPAITFDAAAVPPNGRWLLKPQQGAGGMGISYWRGEPSTRRRKPRSYFQEYIDGEACAAVYATDGGTTHLVGVTRQLVGEPWLHAALFIIAAASVHWFWHPRCGKCSSGWEVSWPAAVVCVVSSASIVCCGMVVPGLWKSIRVTRPL